MAAIQGLVGIVALIFGVIGIGLFGDLATQINPTIAGPRFAVNDQVYYDQLGPDDESGGWTGGGRNRGAGEGVCFSGRERACLNDEDSRKFFGTRMLKFKGLQNIIVLIPFALFGSVALALAGLVGMAAAADKAAPEVMAGAFGTALVFNLVAFGVACGISASTNYGPSLDQISEAPTLALWKTYFSSQCYSTDWEIDQITTGNERCAPSPYVEAALTFAIVNCLFNVVAVLYSVCGQDMAPRVKA